MIQDKKTTPAPFFPVHLRNGTCGDNRRRPYLLDIELTGQARPYRTSISASPLEILLMQLRSGCDLIMISRKRKIHSCRLHFRRQDSSRLPPNLLRCNPPRSDQSRPSVGCGAVSQAFSVLRSCFGSVIDGMGCCDARLEKMSKTHCFHFRRCVI